MDVSLHLYIKVYFILTNCYRKKVRYVWEYSFKMPKEDTVISFKTVEGFLAIYQPVQLLLHPMIMDMIM